MLVIGGLLSLLIPVVFLRTVGGVALLGRVKWESYGWLIWNWKVDHTTQHHNPGKESSNGAGEGGGDGGGSGRSSGSGGGDGDNYGTDAISNSASTGGGVPTIV